MGPDDVHVNDLLEQVITLRGSDLHLTAGSHPVIRVNGELRPLTDFPVLNGSQIRQMVYSIISQKQREKFETNLELDTSYTLPGRSRFRLNLFLQRDSVGCVMRAIPYEIVDFDKLGVPASVRQFAYLPRGLVLVTGPTGSGKSTTLASLIDIVNREKAVPHHDGRGPDRVPAPAQAGAREPARGGRGHAVVRQRARSTCCARTPT